MQILRNKKDQAKHPLKDEAAMICPTMGSYHIPYYHT